MPSITQMIPNEIRRYERLRGSARPAAERLNVFTRRSRLATMSSTSAKAMIHDTLVSKAL